MRANRIILKSGRLAAAAVRKVFAAHKTGVNQPLRSVKPLDPQLAKAIEQTAREQVQKLDEQDDHQDPPCEGGSSSGSSKT